MPQNSRFDEQLAVNLICEHSNARLLSFECHAVLLSDHSIFAIRRSSIGIVKEMIQS